MSVTAATMLPIRRLLASGNKAAAMSKTTFVRCMAASPLAGRKSLYDVLGVAPDSEQAEIKKAFISQSKKMHPDMVRHTAYRGPALVVEPPFNVKKMSFMQG